MTKYTLRIFFALVAFANIAPSSFAQYQPFPDSQLARDGGNGPHFFYRSKTSVTRGTAILLHGCDGITPGLHAHAKRLAETGIASLIPNSLEIRGLKSNCSLQWQVSPRERLVDLAAAIETLFILPEVAHLPFVVIGFGHGGTIAMESSTQRFLTRYVPHAPVGVVTFYPICSYKIRQGPILPILILIGQDDSLASAEQCRELASGSDEARTHIDLNTYPGASHRFDLQDMLRFTDGQAPRQMSEVTADALNRLDAFLNKRLIQEWP